MTELTCPICDGTGWKIVERAGLSGAERCSCIAAGRASKLREAAGIPPNYENATLENFKMPQDNPNMRDALGQVLRNMRGFVRAFPDVNPPGLLLLGENGTGKTHLAVAVLKALIDKGHAGLFFDYQGLLEQIQRSFKIESGTSDREAYGSALDTDVLLLDELGAYRRSDFVEDTITGILTHRCNHGKPIIVTTNLVDEDITGSVVAYHGAGNIAVYKKSLGEVIGRRARSRLFEMCRVVHMPYMGDHRVATNPFPRPKS
jgi:DNA replication protein DnaC